MNIQNRLIHSVGLAYAHAHDDSNRWHGVRNATIRVIRRELTLSKHGYAPVWLYDFANDLADFVLSGFIEGDLDTIPDMLLTGLRECNLVARIY